LVERVDAIVLSGGSAFGLAAADGVMAWLAARQRGFAVGSVHVPIVPAAAVFDLLNGGDKTAIGGGAPVYRDLGFAACAAAGADVAVGTVGAGTGATTADLKGGFGQAEEAVGDYRVAALAVVNAAGRVTLGSTPHFRAAPFERQAEFGRLGLPSPLPDDAAAPVVKGMRARESTTIAVVATDAALDRSAARRLAIAAHDGIALAVYPAHTPFDGDTVFALSTGERVLDGMAALMALSAASAAALARAIARAVFAAEPAPGDPLPTWRQRYHPENR
jgi:L-aminopeptidase/D-esterase-like protein